MIAGDSKCHFMGPLTICVLSFKKHLLSSLLLSVVPEALDRAAQSEKETKFSAGSQKHVKVYKEVIQAAHKNQYYYVCKKCSEKELVRSILFRIKLIHLNQFKSPGRN